MAVTAKAAGSPIITDVVAIQPAASCTEILYVPAGNPVKTPAPDVEGNIVNGAVNE